MNYLAQLFCCVLVICISCHAEETGAGVFKDYVLPLLKTRCYSCHSHESHKARGGLVLDSRNGWALGGDSGPAIVPGKPDESLLMQAVMHTHKSLRMPHKEEKLGKGDIDHLRLWITSGAPDPRVNDLGAPPRMPDPDEVRQTHWSFKPVSKPAIPEVADVNWIGSPIDAFVLARLEAKSIRPLGEADRYTLIRRATYDLTGLPPTPGELKDFVEDESSDAFHKLVERLLASSAYGERWGRHWLDVARYADTAGDSGDFPVPQAYLYRNWVIEAFNSDMPYDQFIIRQIAGDLLPATQQNEREANIIATGYIALAQRFGQNPNTFHLTIDDIIDNIGKATMALSIGCARCHDHKFDPVSNEDYYSMYGILNSTVYSHAGQEHKRNVADLVPLGSGEDISKWASYERQNAGVMKQMEKLKHKIRDAEKQSKTELAKELKEQEETLKAVTEVFNNTYPRTVKVAFAAKEGKPADAPILNKGNQYSKGKVVRRGFLTLLGNNKLPDDCENSGRLFMAQRIADPNNPLTARVMAHRIWLQHFGKPIVATPDDFGMRSQPPTHPELLDYLAARFVESGWRIKDMHRLIMHSSTYKIAGARAVPGTETDRSDNSHVSGEYADPDNRLYWRFDSRRMSAEEVRDSLLSLGGSLDRTPGERHPFGNRLHFPFSQGNPFNKVYGTNRRAVYMMQPRQQKHPFMRLWEGANTKLTTGLRPVSVSPMQALFMMNDPLARQQAAGFARRLEQEKGSDAERIEAAYLYAFSRPPSPDEIDQGLAFLRNATITWAKDPATSVTVAGTNAWAGYCRVLMCSNEFVFVR